MSRRLLVAGNWKQNGSVADTLSLTADIVAGLAASSARSEQSEPDDRRVTDGISAGAEYLVCPTYLHVRAVADAITGNSSDPVTGSLPLSVGAQDCSQFDDGAFTGNVGAAMLKDAGCSYVIVGHSERRQLFGDTDDTVAQKFAAARAVGLLPILCVGETLSERENGELDVVIHRQLDAVLSSVWRIGDSADAAPVIAYEPVWAIGTGKTASPAEAQHVHRIIRARLAEQSSSVAGDIRIVYGGSVKPGNAGELFAQPDIDGGLIGGASLDASDFLSIGKAADQLMQNGI